MKNKVLFVHGGVVVKKSKDGQFYTDGSFSEEVWQIYNQPGIQLCAIFRIENTEINNPHIVYNLVPNYVNIIEVDNMYKSILNFLSLKQRKKRRESIKKSVFNADKVIVRLPSDTGYLALFYSLKYKKNNMVEVVGSAFDSMWHHSFFGKILSIPHQIFMKSLIYRAENVIYVTNSYLQKQYPTLGNAYGYSDVTILPFKENNTIQSRAERIVTSNKIIISNVGSLDVKYKNQVEIINVLQRIPQINFELNLIGSNEGNRFTTSKYENLNINCIGSINSVLVYDYLEKSDIYIHSSMTEGLSRSIIEAMSRGCIVFARDVGGNSELLTKDFLYNTEAELKNKLIDFINASKDKGTDYIKPISIRNMNIALNIGDGKSKVKRNLIFKDFLKIKVDN